MSDYSEAELSLIESRKQGAGAGQPSSSSVDQVSMPKIDRKPQAKNVDLPGMVSDVNEAAKQQQATAPTVFDTLDKDMPWLKWVGGALGVAYGLGKMFGGDDNNPPNNRPPSPKDRSLTRTEPTLNAEVTQSSMTAGEPKIVADPVPVAPKPVTDVVTVPPVPETTANVVPTPAQPQNVPVPTPSEQQPQMKYGETKYNVPVASPEVPVAPPAEVAPAPVQPKPVSELEQLRIEKARFDLEAAKAKEARAAEAHASRLAADAKRAEAKAQTKTASGALTPETQKMLESSERAKADKAIIASQKAAAAKAAPPAASVVPPTSQVVQPTAIAPSTTEGLTKEQKGMKNYLVSQYGGGPEGEAAYKKVIEILGEVPAYEKGQGGGLSKEANEAIKSWRQANIEGPKVNLTHDMKKAMKGAGGIAILAAIPGFAEAAQRKDYGAMTDIASDFFVLPFAQSREAGMPKAQEESIISSKFKEASKLGSPYRSVPPPR